MKRGKEANGEPKHTTRSTAVNAGSPTRGDPHGDGVPIVAECGGAMPETGRRGTGIASILR
jgi:hypothetical protein